MKYCKMFFISVFVIGTFFAIPACSQTTPVGILINASEVASLSTTTEAWKAMKAQADYVPVTPNLSNQEDPENVRVLARALVYLKTGQTKYRDSVISSCMKAIGTESDGRTLALGRELAAYVIAADVVKLPADKDTVFRAWLKKCLTESLEGKTLISTNEDRPNNWGTHAGASRLAVAVYLGDSAQIQRCAVIFKAWLGDRSVYTGFDFGDLSWQSDPSHPRGINPKVATIKGYNVDGVLPDDQRRSGGFVYPFPKENYVYEALQGALLEAIILNRLGYPVFTWEDQALLRSFNWLYFQCKFPASGDDTWETYVINKFYGAKFPVSTPSRPGKNVGYTDWLYPKL